jgi:hypothetical protein
MADGLFYVDSRTPFISADVAAVTLAATAKALIPVANIPVFGSNYFSLIGKAVRIRLFGRITTAATPGNGQFTILTAQVRMRTASLSVSQRRSL